jgi:hypothetical protein
MIMDSWAWEWLPFAFIILLALICGHGVSTWPIDPGMRKRERIRTEAEKHMAKSWTRCGGSGNNENHER